MSMWIIHFEKRAVHVVVDSVATLRSGAEFSPQMYTAKLHTFPHLGCVITGRGDNFYSHILHSFINRQPLFSFDDVAKNLTGLACAAAHLQDQYAAEGLAPPPSDAQEVLLAGYSPRNRRPELHHFMYRYGGIHRSNVPVTEGTWLGPDIAESRGKVFRPRIKVPVVDLVALARKQFAEALTDPDCDGQPAVGGQIVYAGVTHEGITTRVLGFHQNHADCLERIKGADTYAAAALGLDTATTAGWPTAA